MVNIKSLSKKFMEGIPFSAFMNSKRTKKRSRTLKKFKTKKKRRINKTKRKQGKAPPRGVIIRKKDKLYKSDGKRLTLIE